MNINNKWNYVIGTEFHFFKEEKGFIVEDMYKKDDNRHSLYLICKCLECNNIKHIRADSILRQPGCVSHKYCNIISRDIGNKYVDDLEYYNKVRMAFYSAHNRCENPNYPCFDRYNGRGIKVSDSFSHTDIGLQNWLDYLIPMLKERVYVGISNGEFINIKDALNRLSIDRIDDNGDYDYGNLRWVTPDVQIQNRNCMRNFYAISPTNDLYISNNGTRFANENSLIPVKVNNSISNNKSYKGWYFCQENQLFKFDFENPNSNVIDKRY